MKTSGVRIVCVDAATWMHLLAVGRWRAQVTISGCRTVGGRHGPWGFSQRSVNSHIFYGIIKGHIDARWQSGRALLEPGTAFWLAPRVIHDFALAPADRPASLFYFRLDMVDSTGRLCRLREDAFVLHHMERMRYLFEEIIGLEPGAVAYEEERRRGILLLLCAAFLDAREQPSVGRRLTDRQRESLATVIQRNEGRFISPTELANELDLSPEYFARLFANTYGLKPRTWIVRQRVRLAAAALLETSASIAEVAARLGYSDAYFFSRQFRAVMGCSPRAYRRSQLAG